MAQFCNPKGGGCRRKPTDFLMQEERIMCSILCFRNLTVVTVWRMAPSKASPCKIIQKSGKRRSLDWADRMETDGSGWRMEREQTVLQNEKR